MHDRTDNEWRTSSKSAGGQCVEVKVTADEVLVRDSKDRSGPVLAFEPEVFRAFIDDVKADGFLPD
jgi:hypothetical protein